MASIDKHADAFEILRTFHVNQSIWMCAYCRRCGQPWQLLWRLHLQQNLHYPQRFPLLRQTVWTPYRLILLG